MVAGFISYAGVLEKLPRKSSSVVSTKLDRPVTVAEKRTLGKLVAILTVPVILCPLSVTGCSFHCPPGQLNCSTVHWGEEGEQMTGG